MKNIDRRALAVLFAGAALFAAACGKGEKTEGAAEGSKKEEAHETEGAGTGKVIVVETYSDEKGNYFKPAEIEAHPGDLVRFTLKSGVHNVHFLPDSNPGAQGLPPVSDFLQIPEQTYDYLVSLPKGHYYFQCDPHALLGMKGRLEVED